MGSNTHQRFPQPNSALLKFRSAPSSLLANFTDGIDSISSTKDQFEGSESERFVSRFMNSNDSESPTAAAGAVNRMNCQADYLVLPPHYPWPNSVMSSSSPSPSSSSSSMSNSYGLLGSNLARQNSSPAGAFSQHGYGTIRSEGNYSRLSGNNNGEVSPPSNKLNSQISFSSILPSSLDMQLSHISEGVSETIVGGSHINETLGNSRGESLFLRQPSGFLFTSWNESPHFSEPFHGIKRDANIDRKLFSSHQNGEEIGNRVHMLSHHLSLPKNSSDIASIEKLLQLQDAVPCRIRAKRGCATHPRSIAERVRRTRISERMRKLQDLVPNMDKQTNTADMLDLAVEYIKDLQKQFKTLSDNRANCKCLSMQKPVSKPII